MCTGDPCAHFLQSHEGVDVDHVYISELFCVTVRIGFEGFTIYYSLVKHESVSFYELTDVDFFGVGVTSEEIRVSDPDVATFVLRVLDLVEEIIEHDVIIDFPEH